MSKKPQRAPVTRLSTEYGTLEAYRAAEDEAKYNACATAAIESTTEANDREPAPSPQPPVPATGDRLCKLIAAHLVADPPGYKPGYVELKLTSTEAEFMARLRHNLQTNHAQLADGKHIETTPQALRWLLEQTRHHTAPTGS